MSVTHNSLASLQDSVDTLMREGDLETPLEMIKGVVDSVITDHRSVGRLFSSPVLDELCLRLGAKALSQMNLTTPAPVQRRTVYVVTDLFRDGGHSLVAADFVRFQPNDEHIFLKTGDLNNVFLEAFSLRLEPFGAHMEAAPVGTKLDQLRWLLSRLFELAPEKIYWFSNNNDVVAAVAAQPAVPGEKYFIHHGDHHLCLGVHSPHLRHVDLHNLGYINCRDALGISDNVYWPLVCEDLGERSRESLFMASGRLRTSSSGRAEKFEATYTYEYADVIPRMLRATDGDHVHIGYLSEEYLERICRRLTDEGIPQERFIHVPWVQSVWRALIERNVDVYLMSWPIGGGKALVEAMGAGIPPAVHVNYTSRFHSGFDVANAEAMTWRTPDELIDRLVNITAEQLAAQSHSARAHFERHHAPRVLESLLRGDNTGAPDLVPLRDYRPDALQVFLDDRALFDQQIAERDQQIAERDQRIAERDQRIAERDQQIVERDQKIIERDQKIIERDQKIIERDQKIAERDAKINAIYSSRSWRFTRPLRFVARLMRKVFRIIENVCLKIHATMLLGFRAALSKVLPRSIKRILRKLMRVARRTGLFESVVPKLDVLGNFDSIVPERKTVLVVSHEGSRTGAPILSYNLVKSLLKRYNVVALFLGPGPLLSACHASGAIVVGPLMFQRSVLLSDLAVKQIMNAVQIEFALINSIESRYVLSALANRHVPTVSLIHEFAANSRPRGAFPEAVSLSGQVVFSTRLTRDNMLAENTHFGTRTYPVIPQGRCILPQDSDHGDQVIAGEIYRTQRAIRPDGFATEGIVVLGAGLVQFRKGVELFVECAGRVLRKAPDLPFRFIWVGKGYDPEGDVQYSVYLADQIRRAGLEKHVHFIDEVAALETIYAAADILLLSSRLDPLPNVAIDALAVGLPVVCFDKTTGMADILNEHGLGDICVATYLDTEDMACKVLALAQSKELREHVSEKAIRIAATAFDMASYVTEIEQLALKEVDRLRQAEVDIETIAESDLVRLDYYLSPDWPDQSQEDAILGYVRAWASGVGRRKLFPGFHPGIYFEQDDIRSAGADPLADYLRAGQPQGPWNFGLITAADDAKPRPPRLRVGLHIHAYYPELFPEILRRLKQNDVRPDLMISVTSESARSAVAAHLSAYDGRVFDIRVVPNRGRDIGPFLTEFGETIRQKYDLIGHLHTKKTADLNHKSVGRDWYQFLLENLLGGRASMADIILGRMAADPNVGMVFPDDPHIVGWGSNLSFAERLLFQSEIEISHRELCFPVGTMFWARPDWLKALFDLNLTWEDYPEEPLPYDGSMLHALERLFGVLVTHSGGSILLTNVSGVTR